MISLLNSFNSRLTSYHPRMVCVIIRITYLKLTYSTIHFEAEIRLICLKLITIWITDGLEAMSKGLKCFFFAYKIVANYRSKKKI